jgi:hypothetical protein
VDLAQDPGRVVLERPAGIVRLEATVVADPPDVVSDPVLLAVAPFELLPGDLLRERDRFDDRGVAEAAAADVVDLGDPRRLEELVECADQVRAVDRVADLLALVAEDRVRPARHDAAHDVGQEPVQLRSRMVRPRQRPAPEARGRKTEVASVLLHEHVRRHLRRPEEAVQAVVERHVLADPIPVRVIALDLPPGLQLVERKAVRAIAVDLVGRREDERRVGCVQAGCFEQIQRSDGVDVEVDERLLRGPVV